MLVIALVLMRLALGDVLHLPAVEAADRSSTVPMVMIPGEPCPAMAGASTDHPDHPPPIHDGSCCKSAQCPCLHAPALMATLQMSLLSGGSIADVPAAEVHRSVDPPPAFLRPPIRLL
jgi:hypothetical protein